MFARARARCAGAFVLAALSSTYCFGHGFVGDRFFPATITTEDPFAVDELQLSATGNASPDGRTIDAGFEFVKEIFPHFAVGVERSYLWQKPVGGKDTGGWDNLGLSAKYELWSNASYEFLFSVGVDADLGGTGSHRVGESFSTISPTIYFGKGFGDLPDSASFLKPFAVTGTIAQTFPTSAAEPNALQWGIAVEYSLPYLQAQVKNIEWIDAFRNFIPLVEFSMETTENRGSVGTTGTINPGVLWESKAVQIGIEALIPVNHHTGSHVGATVNVQIYIDDILPKVFGHPIFGERS